ncbi:MAG: hypothetical protein H0V66_00715 [Bdellovibrionales bacterium]|nr:hypothetical protein [Bdellovibrionales bacterium]
MEMEIVRDDLISQLHQLINTYLEKYPQVSLNALATRSNIPVSTLRRISLGQQKSDIAPHTVLNLTSYLLKEKNLVDLLKKVDPVIKEYLEKHFGQFIFASEQRVYDVDLNSYLQDQHRYFIYKLAANHNGTTLMEVMELFGRQGEVKVLDMKSLGLIFEEGGRLHAKDKDFSLDLKVASSHLPELVRFYKPETLGQGLNIFYSMSESMSEEAIVEIKNIQREAANKIAAIMDDKNKKGEIPYFSINLAETFLLQTQGELQ